MNKIDMILHPLTGRVFNASKDQYEYLVAGKVVGTISFDLAESMRTVEEMRELEDRMWSEIMGEVKKDE